MPRIPYTFPQPGENPIADRVRERRGARGLTPLDGTLLHAPEIADGWNKLIGTLRTGSSLSQDISELLILRIAAINGAAFEWIHHEHVGRAAGLTTTQLAWIGDISSNRSTSDSPLSPLQQSALDCVDASTRSIRVSNEVFNRLKSELEASLPANITVERQLVEVQTTIGGYNLVSRLLVGLDVGDFASSPVPVPDLSIPYQDYPVWINPVVDTLATRVHFHPKNPKAPALIFINSLLTNQETLWSRVLPSLAKSYTLITFDQRGHGASSSPPTNSTIPELADDVARILDYLHIKTVHGVIGVSQGGATALAFALQYPTRLTHLIACDTQAASPAANKAAWDERIELARKEGMEKLAELTTKRWFTAEDGPGRELTKGGKDWELMRKTITAIDVEAFARSAAALQSYDLRASGLIETLKERSEKKEMKVLLMAGELDGKLPAGLKGLADEIGQGAQFAEVKGAGHLPMLDYPDRWLEIVEPFLAS